MTIDSADFRRRLQSAREQLQDLAATTNDAAKPVELDQTRVGRISRMDAMQAQAMSMAAQQRQETQLKKIATALKRLDDGDFGFCIHCGEEIATARLEIELTTLLCIDCANLAEKEK